MDFASFGLEFCVIGSRMFHEVWDPEFVGEDYFRRMPKLRFLGFITILSSRAGHPMAQSKMRPLALHQLLELRERS